MLEKLNLGLNRLTIPLPFALNHVHAFTASGENGLTIIDTGLNQAETASIWKEAIGNNLVERIILTHLHPDHTGYAGMLQHQTGAEVWMNERDSKDLTKIWLPEAMSYLEKDYHEAAVPKKLAEAIIEILNQFPPYVTPLPEVNHYLKDGEKIKIGKLEYEVLHTPGHSTGLVCFFNHEKSVLLSTDHVLPDITPNIAYWFYGEQNPLQSFENSLSLIKQLDAEYVIPSHGEPFKNANKRIDEIWQHHEKRLEQTAEALKNGVTVYEMCHILFKRKLSVYDYQFAIGETIAHLEYLVQKNVLRREKKSEVWHYTYNY